MNDEMKPCPYQLSVDYERLWDLCFETDIAAFVTSRGCKQIARVVRSENGSNIGTPGVGYGWHPGTKRKDVFIKDCEDLQLEFINPNRPDTRWVAIETAEDLPKEDGEYLFRTRSKAVQYVASSFTPSVSSRSCFVEKFRAWQKIQPATGDAEAGNDGNSTFSRRNAYRICFRR